MQRTTQYLPNGQYNRYYSLLPPALNNSGATMVVIIQSVRLKGDGGEFFGISEERVLLMGNAQAVVSEPCSVYEFLEQFPELSDDDHELVADLITKQIKQLEDSINKQ